MDTSRRNFISKSSLSTLGLVAATSMGSMIPKTAEALTKNNNLNEIDGPIGELEDFVYDIENGSKGWSGKGGDAKEATVEEFPVSQSIAGVIMRLTPGSFRELHWHSIAAEWAYILEGKVRTTVVTPDGTTSTDEFKVGDIWYFPKGHGHCLQCLGDVDCRFLLGFDSGHFSEFGTFSVTDWMSNISPAILAKNIGVDKGVFSKLQKKELYIGTGTPIKDPLPGNISNERSESTSMHKFRMEEDGIYQKFAGGSTRLVSSKEFPIQKTLTALRMDIEPGAMRELHWHPNADEWQYVISGKGNVSIFGSHGRVKTMPYSKGMVSFIKQGYGHYIENIGTEVLKLIILFNSPDYEEISLNSWLVSNPAKLISEHFQISENDAKSIQKHGKGIFK